MDIIYLHGLKVDCLIGVWEWERRIRQAITIDLDMGFRHLRRRQKRRR